MDLCKEKKFINLEGKVYINEKNNRVVSLVDSKNNIWVVENKLSEGATGEVYLYRSCNLQNTDLVIKYFIGESEDATLDMLQETEIVRLFKKNRCKNFIRAGVKELENGEVVVIMERIDGDLTDFDFTIYNKPLEVYSQLIEFLVDGSRCAYKQNKLFLDLKSENIGYKICNSGVKFTFIDLGSFFDLKEEDVMTTFYINYNKYNDGYFSNQVIFVYSMVMTLLNVRLAIQDVNKMNKFIDYFLEKIGNEKKYSARIGLLSKSNYDRIKKKFYSYFNETNHKDSKFIGYLFESLEKLTTREPNIIQFLLGLQNHNGY